MIREIMPRAEAAMLKHYLYLLKDPITFEIKYVGITHAIDLRRNTHLYNPYCRKGKRLQVWIYLMRAKGLFPIFEIIGEYANKEEAHKKEIFLIKKLGKGLLNFNHNRHE